MPYTNRPIDDYKYFQIETADFFITLPKLVNFPYTLI